MNIKKIVILGLVLILSFSMLNLPISVNKDRDQASNDSNPYNLSTRDIIEYSDGTKEIITNHNGKRSIEIVDGGETPISIAANNPGPGEVGADADCDYFSIYSKYDSGLGEYIYFKFVFHIWCEYKPFPDFLYEFYCSIWVDGVGTFYSSDKEWHDWPRDVRDFTRTVYTTDSIPTSWAGRSYQGYCWGKDDDSYDTDLFDDPSETGSDACTGTIFPTPYHNVDLQCTSGASQIIYDNETAVYYFYIKNQGNLMSERFHISLTGLSIASAYISMNDFWLSPGQSTTFSITMDPTNVGTASFTVTATSYDYGTTKSIGCSLTVIDDDITPPEIGYTYTGDYTDGNPGSIIVTASDESGLFDDPSGTYSVPNILGDHDFFFSTIDDDNDRSGDRLPNTKEVTINIQDDDTTEPYFENIMINDDHLWLNISFNGIDLQEGDDLGLSLIEIYVDNALIHTYLPTSIEDTFNFSFINVWIFEKGVHDIRVVIFDADNDRTDDVLSNEFSGTFEVTMDEMYEFVIWQLEELKNYVDENLEGILSWSIRFLLWGAQDSLRDAYKAFLEEHEVFGLLKDKFAQVLTYITGFIVEIFNYWELISDEDAQFIILALHSIRNNIVWLMGESVGVEQSINIASIEVELLNLNDLIDENINHTTKFTLKFFISCAILKLEVALFKIVLDKSTECMLTGAQIMLDYALAEVDNLLNSGKISQELADTLNSKIMQVQVDIEMVKNSS